MGKLGLPGGKAALERKILLAAKKPLPLDGQVVSGAKGEKV